MHPIMRITLALILLAFGTASAIPLAIGNTWVYERGISGKLDTLKALDTARCDSGRLWTLLWNRDTSRIIERPNGRQSWVTGFVPNMELEPESVAVRANSLYPKRLGVDSLNIIYWSFATEAPHYSWEFKSPQPRFRFSDSLGVVWVEGGCNTCKELESRTLRTFNGKDVGFSVADVMDSLPMGAGRLWEHMERFERNGKLETSSQAFFGWTVVSKLPDSAGWMRRRILQTEEASGAASRREVDWRWNLRGGDIVGDTAWWAKLVARGVAPKVVDSAVENEYVKHGRVVGWSRRVNDGKQPALYSTSIHAKEGVGPFRVVDIANHIVSMTTNTLTLLWSRDSGCPCAVGVQRRQIPSEVKASGFADLLRSHPDSRVEWRDAAGRNGSVRASQALERMPRGILLVRVVLADRIASFRILRP